jgi:hypothetical protein
MFLFDEKSGVWIKIFKALTILLFIIIVIGSIIYAIEDSPGGFFGGLLVVIAGVAIGFVFVAGNMLIIQLLTNIQIIREKIEKDK